MPLFGVSRGHILRLEGEKRMPFAPDTRPTYTSDETRKRTSAQYIKFSEDYRTVIRVLNPEARMVWKHWISEANAGRGLMANCPNTSSQVRPCPIEKSLQGLPKTDSTYLDRRARKRFIVNVLDRTPYTVCNTCNTDTPKAKSCQNCGADISKGHEFAPLNRVKLLEGGPELFVTNLNALEKLQAEEFDGSTILDYDISISASGKGRDRKLAAIPQAPSELPTDVLNDPENEGEVQKLFDLDKLTEPSSVEEIELMLQGATMDELNAVRGVA